MSKAATDIVQGNTLVSIDTLRIGEFSISFFCHNENENGRKTQQNAQEYKRVPRLQKEIEIYTTNILENLLCKRKYHANDA